MVETRQDFEEALRQLALAVRDPLFTPFVNRLRSLIDSHEAVKARAERAEALVNEAWHLFEYGERAPGGNETWAAWHQKARALFTSEKTNG